MNKPMLVETLCAVMMAHPCVILLQHKAKGLFGGGNWNMPGGKVKQEESLGEAAIREVEEEAGIQVASLVERGRLMFYFPGEDPNHLVYVFQATSWSYNFVIPDTNEGSLAWWLTKELPYDQMWADDKYWMPLFLEGKNFEGEFTFGKDGNIEKHVVEEVTGGVS